ncbi:PD-(D/E)XK nuclease family protein [Candidatus Dependentiae bacterium]|nr:PD-(D/E)XK nuclease family protein [Candidatus Dependentiae bacterium]
MNISLPNAEVATPVRNNCQTCIRSISYSELTCYINCPLKYRFKYIDKIVPDKVSANIACGKSIHSALSFYYTQIRNKSKPKPEQVVDVFHQYYESAEAEGVNYNGQQKDEICETAANLLKLYCDTIKPPKKIDGVDLELRTLISNPNTSETLDGYELLGYIDLFADKTVFDFKTAKVSKSQADTDSNLQVGLYALAVYLSPQYAYIPKLTFQVLLKQVKPKIQEISTTRQYSDFNRLFKIIKGFISNTENQDNVYLPCQSFYCYGCEYAFWCQARCGGALKKTDYYL